MNANRLPAILHSQYRKAVSAPNPYVWFAQTADPKTWWILIKGITGSEGEFTDGEYLCRMVATDDFPYKPPEFYFATPTGIYGVNRKVCIHIGEYHSNSYIRTLGMSGFADQLVSGLIGWRDLSVDTSIGMVKTSSNEKLSLAKASREFNQRLPEYKLVCDAYAEYSRKWTPASPKDSAETPK